MMVSKASNEANLEVFAAYDVFFVILVCLDTLNEASLEGRKVLRWVFEQPADNKYKCLSERTRTSD